MSNARNKSASKKYYFRCSKKREKKVAENKRKTISGNKVTLAAVDDAKKP